MSNVDFRLGKRPFYDNKRFRRGFAKSGDFTLVEEDILIRFGDTMSLLESGDLSPESEAEQHFIEVLKDERHAESKLEKTWIKYIHLARDRKRFHALNGKNTASEASNDDSDYDTSDDMDERLVNENLDSDNS